jgi:multiple RNA-binding domain-containing protein 1
VPLYIEWAPLNIIKDMKPGKVSTKIEQVQKNTVTEIVDDQEYGTIYVKNLNFVTTEEDLYNHLQRLNIIKGIRKISIPVNSKQGTGNMSMGYGFIEYNNSAHATQALVKLNESVLHDHSLEAKKSEKRLTSVKKSSNSSISANNSKNNKLVVRNVAFQATSSELKTLFSSYGNVKRVRIPKKMGGEHRGFAFIDFSTNQEAVNAMESLKTTHLYGRHLVIEWAKEDDDNEGLSSSNINNLRKRASIDVKKKNNNNSTIQSKKRKTSDDMVDPDFNFNQSIDDLDEVDDDDDDNNDN